MPFFDKDMKSVVSDLKSGKKKCIEIVEESLARIEKGDAKVNAFTNVHSEEARIQARELDNLNSEEKAAKPLLGIPVAVKDNICTKGIPTTCSSKMLQHFVPPYDAAVVQFLKEAGAVIVGKTNMDEFAMGSSTETAAGGLTRNPNNTEYTPGGSSGGSAAAVAAGFVPLALGSDTGGSIRQPCSHCGVIGMKPTYGRVSRYGLVAFASSLDQIGPVATDIRDAGLLLSVIAGEDARDSTCAGKPFENDDSLYTTDLRSMKLGIPKEYFGEGLSDTVRNAVQNTIDALVSLGAEVVDISLPHLQYAIAAYYIICTAEASSNLARYDGVKYGFRSDNRKTLQEMYCATREEGFGAEVKRRIMLGTYVLSSGYYDAYYLKGAKVRTLIGQDFDHAFTSCDAIVSPVAPTPAFRIGEKVQNPLQMYLTDTYTVSANLAGIPGISIPCGKHGDLPIGVQFMAPKWREDTLMKLGYATQTLME
ncbi:MAG: Asp-tRNA(Asn)/Glu-tRNA(Gln) amidotransferase subunit GatA [Chitinispirillaceae bacterium]